VWELKAGGMCAPSFDNAAVNNCANKKEQGKCEDDEESFCGHAHDRTHLMIAGAATNSPITSMSASASQIGLSLLPCGTDRGVGSFPCRGLVMLSSLSTTQVMRGEILQIWRFQLSIAPI